MKYEICGTNYKKIDTLLVCEQGHTLENRIEVAHDDTKQELALKIKKVRKAKTQKYIYKNSVCNLND